MTNQHTVTEYMKKDIAEDIWTFEEIIMSQSQSVSPEAIAALKNSVSVWECRKGEAIVDQYEKCDKWIFVSKGLHRVMFSKNGKDDTLFFDGGGAIFTSFHSICADKTCIFRVEALRESYGWEISHYKYSRLQEKYPDLMKFEIGLLRHQLYSLEDYYCRRALSTPQERYEKFWSKRQEKLQFKYMTKI